MIKPIYFQRPASPPWGRGRRLRRVRGTVFQKHRHYNFLLSTFTNLIKVDKILLRRMKYQEGDAFNKHPIFSGENEIRLELSATSLLTLDDHNPEPSLYQLVQYIKCTCPSIIPYCSVYAINP